VDGVMLGERTAWPAGIQHRVWCTVANRPWWTES